MNGETFARSIHGERLICSDCHRGYANFPHPSSSIPSLRDYAIAQYEVCKRCHFANYTKTLDSIHFNVLSQGNQKAPLCTDCHGSHYVIPPDKPRSKISQTCATCHESISRTYVDSVHGKALVEENNQDVPVCTDCHGVHNIHDPRTASFRQQTPALCGQCHTNKALMQKYGLSTQVLQTYLQDFHGATVSLQAKQSPGIWSNPAVCTDCHGIHDIRKTDAPNSPVMKANLVETCRKCHPDATTSFPNAWLSHYEPTPEKAPLVYYAKQFYTLFIPFVVGGLILHVLLDIWRAASNR